MEEIACQDPRAEAEVCIRPCYFFNLISITGKSLMRQRRTPVMPVTKEDSKVSCRLYENGIQFTQFPNPNH